jgi:hypothetical protein
MTPFSLVQNFYFVLFLALLSACNSGPVDRIETTGGSVGTPTPANAPPTMTSLPPVITTNEDQPTGNFLLRISDSDSTLTCASILKSASQNNPVLLNDGIIISGTAPFCYVKFVPIPQASGSASVEFSVFDGTVSSTPVIITFTVVPINDPPTIFPIANQILLEDIPFSSIPVILYDRDSVLTCTSSILKSSSNPAVLPASQIVFGGIYPNCTMSLTSAANASGSSTITLTVTDATSAYLSQDVTFEVTVLPVNDAPTISDVSDQSTVVNISKTAIPFTIGDIDSNLNCASSVLTATSNPAILATSGIVISGTAPNCFMTLNPVPNAIGVVTASLTVSDGTLTASDSFDLSISLSSFSRMAGGTNASSMNTAIVVDANFNTYLSGYTDGNFEGENLVGLKDAYIVKYNSIGVKQWAVLAGVSGAYTYGESLVVDANGNVFLTGSTTGSLHGQTQSGLRDLFLIKYNSSGVRQWTKQSGAAASTSIGQSLALDSSGNVLIAGSTTKSLDGQMISGNKDALIMKFDNNGAKLWTKLLGGAHFETSASSIAIDSVGNIYLSGNTNGNLDSEIYFGTSDSFITKYNNAGIKQWTKLLGGTGFQTISFAVAVDPLQNVYLTGLTKGGLDDQSLAGEMDVFLAKWDSSGAKLWTRQSGVLDSQTVGKGIAVDSNANVYVVGHTYGSLDGQVLTGTSDAFLLKYTTDGSKQWTKLKGIVSAETYAHGISLDRFGNPSVGGISTGDFNGELLKGIYDSFLTNIFAQ